MTLVGSGNIYGKGDLTITQELRDDEGKPHHHDVPQLPSVELFVQARNQQGRAHRLTMTCSLAPNVSDLRPRWRCVGESLVWGGSLPHSLHPG
jgi:hypothetical protein